MGADQVLGCHGIGRGSPASHFSCLFMGTKGLKTTELHFAGHFLPFPSLESTSIRL